MAPSDLDVLVDELYALPLERFVPERDVLAKQLRAEGRREDAARVGALAKPSIGAWAVNQVVRAQPQAAKRLWGAGDEVLDTQARVVSGEATGPELRQAIEAERRALAPLSDAARGLMTGSGRFLGEQNVQAVTESLHAGAIDPAARPQIAEGRLVKPLRLTGLEAALATGGSRGRTTGAEDATAAAPPERLQREETDAGAEAARRRAERERRARRQAAERALVRAEGEREQARTRVAGAVRHRDEAAADVARLERELERAAAGVGTAEERLAAAHGALEDAEDAVERARAEVQDR